MKRSEAYHILGKMWGDATPEQAEALSIAQNDIEFVDLMPKDMVAVVRCKDCKHYGLGACLKIYSDGAASVYAWQYRKPDDFCSYGERRADE